jgi:hypothetical protein
MKKFVTTLVAVVATAAVVVGVTSASGGPLYEEHGIACGVLDRDGSFVLTFDSVLIQYASGKVYLRCESKEGTGGAPKVTLSGFLCGLGPFGTTTNSVNTVGYNGVIQLTCIGHSAPTSATAAATGPVGAG